MPSIKLYEFTPTRSKRVRWTLLEAGLPFESRNDATLFGSEELRKIHPLGKLPAVEIDGQPLFESAAISTHIADLAPDAGLIAPSGTRDRALHDQWVCFALTEMEAWLWSNALNTFVLPEEERNASVFEQNGRFFQRGAAVLDAALADEEYLVGGRFSVTDIVVGYTVNWGKQQGLIKELAKLEAYLQRLLAREHCTLGDG